jgi:hypothetical protein
MLRISQLLADSLSQTEFRVLQKIPINLDGWTDTDLRVLDILGSLRLVETDSKASNLKLTVLGHSVLCERMTSDLQTG